MATASVTYQPAAGQSYVDLTSWAGDASFTTTPVAGDQIEGPDTLTLNADGTVTGADGTYTLRHIIAATGQVEAIDYQIGTATVATLTNATGAADGQTAATGTVDTDTGSGDLYVLASTNASEDAATIKAASLSQPVTASGTQTVAVSGLDAGTEYYLHYVQVTDGNDSNVEPSTAFTTDAEPSSATTTVAFTAGTDYTTATLEEGFDPYNFQQQPQGEPAVGWQVTTLTADGYFDSMGNYWATVEHIHDIWFTDLNGVVYHETVDNTGLKIALTGTITIGQATIGRTTASIPFSYSGTDADGYQYSLDGGAWTNVSSPIGLTNLTASTEYTVKVRAYNATSESPADTLTFTTNAAVDNVPADFAPQTRNDVARSYPVEFTPVTVTDVDAGVDLPVTITNGEYAVSTDGGESYGAFTNAQTNVRLNYMIIVRHTSSDNYTSGDHDGTKTTELDVAGTVGTFTSVTVADTEAPVISLTGGNREVVQGSTFTEPGYTATDNADGDLTMQVQVTGTIDTSVLGPQQLTYSVSDSSGNSASVTRTVTVVEAVQQDQTAPVITLSGGNRTLTVGDTWSEPGFTATDETDGDLTNQVVVTGSVDTTKSGSYTLNYTVSDAAGNEGTASRTVTVLPATQYPLDVLAPVTRTYIATRSLRIEAGERAFVKQPGEILDYDFDVSDWLTLQDDDLSEDVLVTAPDGIEIVGQGRVTGQDRVKVWLSEGSDGYTYPITLTMTTTGGRTAIFKFRLLVLERMAA